MIVQKERKDGLMVTWSNEAKYIIQNETGRKYMEAIDVQPLRYTYTETDEIIDEIVNATEGN